MATYEHNALQNYKDNDGNIHIVYPVTKSDNVDGIENYATTMDMNNKIATKADYEEGTWTPSNRGDSSIQPDTSVYRFNSSIYIKIGKIVVLTTEAVSVTTDGSADVIIYSHCLPFTLSRLLLANAMNKNGVSSIVKYNATMSGAMDFGDYSFSIYAGGVANVTVTIVYEIAE